MVTVGRIIKEEEDGITIYVPRARKPANAHDDVVVEFVDRRRISPQQRRKAYALIRHISLWAGYLPTEAVKALMKHLYREDDYSPRGYAFSLSDCDMETARGFIDSLVTFCVEWGVPTGRDMISELAEDIPKYVWACLINKKCAVCGDVAQLHHVDAVGRRSRREICHIGMRVLPLCGKHHAEAHAKLEGQFLKEYLLEPIPLTQEIGKIYRLTKKNMGIV